MTHGVTINGQYDTVYEKCLHCHLFIDYNLDDGDLNPPVGIAAWIHMSRGDIVDDAIERTHDATPSGLIATSETWQKYGPILMRQRYVDATRPERDDLAGQFLLHAWAIVHAVTYQMREKIVAIAPYAHVMEAVVDEIDGLDAALAAVRAVELVKGLPSKALLETLEEALCSVGQS